MKRLMFFRKPGIFLGLGLLLGFLIVSAGGVAVHKTSSDKFCASCHIHPQATTSWRRSTHYDNRRGIRVHCVDCHLPPRGRGYLVAKARTGTRDLWGKIFKDPLSLNWEERSSPEYARKHVYETSCIRCHENNFPIGLSPEGQEAHLYFERKRGEVQCINCHLAVGHYTEGMVHAKNVDFGGKKAAGSEIFTAPARLEGFADFMEYVPGTQGKFEMLAGPGGTFTMGSPENEKYRSPDEGPCREVHLSSFYMGKYEVSWEEYLAFFRETASQGKTSDTYLDAGGALDAISGPGMGYGKISGHHHDPSCG